MAAQVTSFATVQRKYLKITAKRGTPAELLKIKT